MNIVRSFIPPGPVAKKFLQSDAPVRGLMGPVGSGKTTTAIIDIIRKASKQKKADDGIRYTRVAIIRNTYPELKSTTIKSWCEWFDGVGSWNHSSPITYHLKAGDIDLEVLFLALDRPSDIKKLLSLEVTIIWFNEARQIAYEIFEAARPRTGRYPNKERGVCSWHGIILDTNPPDVDSWYYKLAEVDTPDGWEFYRQPGGLHPNAENLDNIAQTEEGRLLPLGSDERREIGRRYYIENAKGASPEWVKIFIDAEYGFLSSDKAIYPEFKDSLHVKEFGLLRGAPIYVGIDFGLTPAAVFAQKTAMGKWLIHSEIVTEDMGCKRFSEIMLSHINERYEGYEFAKICGDPAGDTRSQSDETTPFQILKASGINAVPAGTNDFVKRRESVAMCMTRIIDGDPGLLIHPRCSLLRKGMSGGYKYRRIQSTGDTRYNERPDKNIYSHVCESLQYLLLGGGEGKNLIKRKYNGIRQRVANSSYNIMG